MRALLILNPAATTTTPHTTSVLCRALDSASLLTRVDTTGRGHAMELAATAAEQGYEAVIVLGGDGSVNEVINGLLADGPGEHIPALGVVPGGSTNVFARNLGIEDGVTNAVGQLIDALDAGRTRPVSLATANGRYFTFAAGLGLDGATVRGVEAARRRGIRSTPALYLASGVRAYARMVRRAPDMRLNVAGMDISLDPLKFVMVTNTSPWTYIGGRGISPTPGASFARDLDVVGMTTLAVHHFLTQAAAVTMTSRGAHGKHVVLLEDVEDVLINASAPVPLQLDGDYIGEVDRVSFRSMRDALRVLM